MTKQLTRSAVRIYGALSALGNDTGNVLEGLLPFFDPILRQHNGEKLDPTVIAADVRSTWKWNFNTDLVETFVPYLERQGWIVADIVGSKDTTYTINMVDNGPPSASDLGVEAELSRIAVQFKKFSEELSPLTAIPRDVEEFEDILVEWLLYVEAFSDKSIEFKTGYKPDPAGTLRPFVEVPKTTSLRDEEKFLCARFVKHAIEQDGGTAEVLARIAAIGLLTEVVQDFVKPVTSVDRSDLIVYLDAPVAMELLGVSGKAARENTSPVVEELLRIGASVRVFGQSLEEIKNSLQAVLRNPRPTGPTAQALARGEVVKQYVTEASLDPGSLLERLGVKATYRTLDLTPSEHQYFTAANRQDLYGRLRYSENPTAREHDTDITTFVVRQRRGRTSRDIFKSHAIVLTRNGLLAQIVRRVSSEIDGQPDEVVAPVVHRRVLATSMWLRTGMGARDLNIPKRMLLANCERVLSIRPGVVEAVKRLTDALGDTEKVRQLDLLISQDRSVQALMDKTLGSSSVVTEENLPLLWQEMLHPHLEAERLKGLENVTKAKADGKRQLAKVTEQHEKSQQQKEQEKAQLGAVLAAKHVEDRDLVVLLCEDVARELRKRRIRRICVSIFLGLVFSIPLVVEATPLVRWVSFGIGWLSAYLTATGGKIVGTTTDAVHALKALRSLAERRKLAVKLDQFDVTWNKTVFEITDRPQLPVLSGPTNLFSAVGQS